MNPMAAVEFRLSSLGDNVHSTVFDHFGAMFADLFIRIETQKAAIGHVEMRDNPVGVRYQCPVMNAVKYEAVDIELFLKLLNVFRKKPIISNGWVIDARIVFWGAVSYGVYQFDDMYH